MAKLNENIKEMRHKKHLTLLEVAEYLGVKEATVQRYESGNIKNLKHETICKLAELFDCDPMYLMGWGGNNPGTDQAAELLRVFNSMNLKGQTLLLSHAYELEEQYGEK